MLSYYLELVFSNLLLFEKFVSFILRGIWLIFAALLAVDSQNDNSVFPKIFVVMLIIGMIASIVMTCAGLYRG